MGRTPASALCCLFIAGCAATGRTGVPDLPPSFPRFPADLAAETTYFPQKDAAIVLVQVRQTHVPPEMWPAPTPPRDRPDGVPAEFWPAPVVDAAARGALLDRVHAANESQRAVHRVLGALADDGWRRVFVEGEPTDALVDGLSAADEYTSALRRIDALLDAGAPSLVLRFGETGTDDAGDDLPWDAVRFAPGADLLLALEGRVRLVAAERPDLLAAAKRALAQDGVAAADAYSDAREDAMLASVAASGDRAAVLLLGAAHDLSDNVARWNRGHPERRMTLVVVTP